MAGVDYGVVAFENGKQKKPDDSTWNRWDIGDIRVNIYKKRCVIEKCLTPHKRERLIGIWEANGRKSYRVTAGGVTFHFKVILPYQVTRLTFSAGGNHYTYIYGYGIDESASIWHRYKKRYLGKRGAKIVDNAIREGENYTGNFVQR